jgi:hypothetical protein
MFIEKQHSSGVGEDYDGRSEDRKLALNNVKSDTSGNILPQMPSSTLSFEIWKFFASELFKAPSIEFKDKCQQLDLHFSLSLSFISTLIFQP